MPTDCGNVHEKGCGRRIGSCSSLPAPPCEACQTDEGPPMRALRRLGRHLRLTLTYQCSHETWS